MHLKSLTLKGFKSFAKKTTLDFDEGISCVVGPNGSGKSNISDAILWVLGERSAKNIRGDSMQDVIFAGTKAKSKSAMAEVSLCLDNTDGTLNYDFTTIEITRRMYRSGESDYWLNNAPVRRLDVLNILHDSGLGEGTHSIISQGSLDSVLSFDDMQLKSIIEETAGILKHKQKKIKSLKKLEAMQANVDRISDVVIEIERQLAPLKRRAKRAEIYLEIKDELADANLKIAVDDHKKAISKKEELQKEISEKEESLREIECLIEKTNAEISHLTAQIQEQNNLRGQHDVRAKKFSELLNKLQSASMLLNQVKDQLNSQNVHTSSDAERASVQLTQLRGSLQEDSEKLGSAKQEQQAISEKLEKIQAEVISLQEKFDEIQAKISDASTEKEEREKKIRRINDEINERIAEAEGKKARLAYLNEKKESLERNIAEADELLKDKREQISTTEGLLADLKARDVKAKELTSTCLNARKVAEDALSQARVDLDACKAQLSALEKIAKTQDVAASVAAFVESSNRLTSDDFLMKSITVEKGYESVVELVLANFTDALVVEENADVIEVKSEVGEFSPSLTLMVSDTTSQSTKLADANCLLDHVKAKECAKGAISALLGEVYVCETLEDCLQNRAMHPEVSFVTMQGEGVFSNGAVKLSSETGLTQDDGILFRKRQIEELKTILEKNKSNVEDLTNKVNEAVNSLSEAQETSLKITQQLTEIQAKFDASKVEVSNKEDEFGELQKSLKDVIAEIENSDVEREDGNNVSIETLRETLKAEEGLRFTGDEQLKTLNDEADEMKSNLDSKRAEDAALRPQFAVLNERCAHLRALKDSHIGRVKSLERRIERLKNKRETNLNKVHAVESFISSLTKAISSFERKTVLFDATDPESESKMKQMFDKLSTSREIANAKSKEKDAIFERISSLKVELTKVDVALESATTRIEENFDGELLQALSLPDLEDRDVVSARASELSEKMKKLGSIDLSARADYESLQQRFDFLNSNLNDIKASILAIEKIDGFIEKRFKEQFSSTFADVNSNFSEIFKKLFPGGFGELSLTNPDDLEETGVEISANPAGKKIRKISLLSGGEKSLVAMSFLFALHSARKTPFYVLDEVEAALDDTNLVRLLTYIDSMRNATQFIFITHQRRTMEMSDALFGVSMGSDGITKVISQKLNVDMLDLNEAV